MSKNKRLAIIAILIGVAVIAALILWKVLGNGGGSSQRKAYVTSVKSLNYDIYGSQNRFTGQVVSQDTVNINKDSGRTVKEILVEVGDEVKKGDALFTYDLQEMELSLAQAQLDVDSTAQNIDALEKQVASLTREKAYASSSEQLEYTIEIQSVENDIRKARYELEEKKLTAENLAKAMEDNSVKSPMDGVIKSINTGEEQNPYGQSSETGFISIMSKGDYRIKGSINEQNVYQINVGDEMIIHSRVDDSIWHGTISKIDKDTNTNENMNNNFFGGSGNGEGSVSYPFYVEVKDPDGLMMGQHVYMEQDVGQGEAKTGIWLMSGYITEEGESAFIWVRNNKDRLEKRDVTLGEYDPETDEYQIVSGITEDDYIAWPEADLKEGMGTTEDYEEAYPPDEGSDGQEIYYEDGEPGGSEIYFENGAPDGQEIYFEDGQEGDLTMDEDYSGEGDEEDVD